MSHALLLIPTLVLSLDKPVPNAVTPVAPLAVVKAEKVAAVLRESVWPGFAADALAAFEKGTQVLP